MANKFVKQYPRLLICKRGKNNWEVFRFEAEGSTGIFQGRFFDDFYARRWIDREFFGIKPRLVRTLRKRSQNS